MAVGLKGREEKLDSTERYLELFLHCRGELDSMMISPAGPWCQPSMRLPAGYLITGMVTPPQAPTPAGGAGLPSNRCSCG
jgi:hypothetical protein